MPPEIMAAAFTKKRKDEVFSERALAVLWRKAHTLPDGLVARNGRRFRVIYPGRANHRAGPDFHDAIIATEEGDRISGDVELHLNAPDWRSHRHDTDPGYNGVILHVVLRPKRSLTSQRQSGELTPVVSLAAHVPRLKGIEDIPRHSLPQLQSMSEQSFYNLLDHAGDERFFARSRGFALEIADGDADQVLYRSIMEALGYASNRKPFRELAERVPVSLLMQLRKEPPATRLLALRAMLIGASGMSGWVRPAEDARLLRRLRRRLPRVRAMTSMQWNIFRVRPANHPLMRLTGAAQLVDRFMDSGLARGLEQSLLQADAAALSGLLTFQPFIGEDRARDIAVNVVLPFLYAYGGIGKSPRLQTQCCELYHAFPKLSDNEITREMLRLISSGDAPMRVTSARRQQGLIHLYKTSLRER